jgi:hypothetical protein
MLTLARVALVLLGCAGVARAADAPIDWQNAALCVGQVCALRGTVVESENDGPTIRLFFDAQRTVRILLMRGWLVTWPDYAGATIVARGKVHRFRDHVEMIVLAPGDITVLDALPSPTPSPGPSPTPGELERLRERVRELEQELREKDGR